MLVTRLKKLYSQHIDLLNIITIFILSIISNNRTFKVEKYILFKNVFLTIYQFFKTNLNNEMLEN
jgi:hypothetical protein